MTVVDRIQHATEALHGRASTFGARYAAQDASLRGRARRYLEARPEEAAEVGAERREALRTWRRDDIAATRALAASAGAEARAALAARREALAQAAAEHEASADWQQLGVRIRELEGRLKAAGNAVTVAATIRDRMLAGGDTTGLRALRAACDAVLPAIPAGTADHIAWLRLQSAFAEDEAASVPAIVRTLQAETAAIETAAGELEGAIVAAQMRVGALSAYEYWQDRRAWPEALNIPLVPERTPGSPVSGLDAAFSDAPLWSPEPVGDGTDIGGRLNVSEANTAGPPRPRDTPVKAPGADDE